MLADPKSWADLGKSLRLRVERPAGRHLQCTLRVGRSRLKTLERVGGQGDSSEKNTGMEEFGTVENEGMGRMYVARGAHQTVRWHSSQHNLGQDT